MTAAALPETDASFDSGGAPVQPASDPETLILDIDGYEGPLDVLLTLARAQKVDLRKISILALADQYLGFIATARSRSLELAADYLVMAAWLAFIKSRLLLPVSEIPDDEPDPEAMAEALAQRLAQLDAMRRLADRLMRRDRLGQTVFPRGAAVGVSVAEHVTWTASLYDLLKAYARTRTDAKTLSYNPPAPPVFTLEAARHAFEGLLGTLGSWQALDVLVFAMTSPAMPGGLPPERRSMIASSLTAGLALVKEGRLEMRQAGRYAPIYVRAGAPA